MDTIDAATAAIRQIRGERPAVIRVFLDEGEVANVGVPSVKRWKARTASTLSTLPWHSFEPLNAKGELIGGRIDNPGLAHGGATELEELDLEAPSGPGMGAIVGLLQLMLKAQDTALVRQKQAYDSVLVNNQKLLEVMSARLSGMETQAHENLQLIRELQLSAGSGDADDAATVEAMRLVSMAMANQKNSQGPNGTK